MISNVSAAAAPYVTAPQAASARAAEPERSENRRTEPNDASPRTEERPSARTQTDQSAEELRLIRQMASTDRQVRAHEAAHMAAAGGLAQGGPSLETQQGPDGRNYAVAGEVSIDVSPGRTPEETIRKAEQVRRAALAPADPSAQDYRVAAQAAQMMAEAQRELAAIQRDAANGADGASNALSRAINAYAETEPESSPALNLFA